MIRLSLYAKTAHRNIRNTDNFQEDDYTNYEPISSEQLIQEALIGEKQDMKAEPVGMAE